MVTVKSGNVEISVAERGAEIRRLTVDGIDRLWSGDPAFWSSVSPILFPICGALKDDTYTARGNTYTLEKHGFAKSSDFVLFEKGNNFVTFLLTDTPETYAKYPWHFELFITYKIIGKCIEVTYEVRNISDDRMFFSIGAHEGYACPEGIENYDIIFEKNENLDTFDLDDGILAHTTHRILTDSKVLPLYNDYFKIDAMIFKGIRSHSATLRNRVTGKSTTVEFPDFPYLLIWTLPSAPFVCIEPWCGIPPTRDADIAIEKKEGIISLEKGEKYSCSHRLIFD